MTPDLNALIERWPGYTEQSWAERFHELDRRYEALSQNFDVAIRAAMRRYIKPDSGLTAEQFAGEVIGIVDGRARHAEKPHA